MVISYFDENFEGGLMGVARKNKYESSSNGGRVVLFWQLGVWFRSGEIKK